MARNPRKISESGIYHVMLRGMNKQQVFLDEEDNRKFLSVVSICKELSGFKLYAYCLMGNHVHLLIQEGEETLSKVFKRIGDRYVYWYNLKYKKTGALFQGRYKSIPVNDDEYFISVLRYIHQNPVKAGIADDCSDYAFSSYNTYLNPYYNSLCDTDFALEMIGANEFNRIHKEPCVDNHLDINEKTIFSLTDDEAKNAFKNLTHCKTQNDFKNLPKDMQSAYVGLLKENGLSIRQICSLTGFARYSIYK
ncbi:MAG: transposase [Eubacterium sp.]|nr:transposase [Eubacterium sp.]